MSLKSLTRSITRRLGLELHQLAVDKDPMVQLVTCLGSQSIELVLDIGANEGQFSQDLRAFGYEGHIVSFEPMAEPHGRLSTRAAGDAAWQVHSPTAIGERDGHRGGCFGTLVPWPQRSIMIANGIGNRFRYTII